MAAATSQRPWEMGTASPGPTSTPRGQLPSITALTNNLPVASGSTGLPSPASTRERDSGAWSSQPQSTRSSTYSNNTSNYMSSNTNSYYMSPNRISAMSNSSQLGTTSHPSGDYSIHHSSIGSPRYASAQPAGNQLPSLNQAHDPNRNSVGSAGDRSKGGGVNGNGNGNSGTVKRQSQDFPPQESRRSSLGSQVNQGMNSLQINGTSSPYGGSVNHSTTSLAQNLNRERGIGGGGATGAAPALRNSRSSAQLPMSPLSPTVENRPTPAFGPRIAPPIGRNPRSDVYNADEPVPGQAYAFPDTADMEPGALPPKNTSSRHNLSSSSHGPNGDLKPGLFNTRRDSGHTSLASSVMTSDSRLPPGQHRLEEGRSFLLDADAPAPPMPNGLDAHAMGGMQGNTHHHHSLQQNQMSNLNEDDPMTPEEGSQPYSRTPALRVSHKMAERKRRSEMKDLFENLRSQIPSSQGSKSSKWEILMKASDYIKQLEGSASNSHVAEKQLRLACHDLDLTRRDNDSLRNENQRLMQELQMLRQQPPQQHQHQHQQQQQAPPQQAPPPPPPHPSQSQPTGGPQQPNNGSQQSLYPSHYVPPPPPQPPMHDPSRSLPPLTNGVGPGQQVHPHQQQQPPTPVGNASSSMQGVQYSHEQR